MKGSVKYQVHTLFLKSGIDRIGQSKHAAKETVRQSMKTTGQNPSWHKLGKEMGIHSTGTRDTYEATWRHVLDHAKTRFGIRDIEKLTGQHIQFYLESKISESENRISNQTFLNYSAACEKLETALNLYAERMATGRYYLFTPNIELVRETARESKLERFLGNRAYESPRLLIDNLRHEAHQLAARIQYEGGARISEANRIRQDQLKGVYKDPCSGRPKGHFEVQGKGGKIREIRISLQTYKELKETIEQKGSFTFNERTYRDDLEKSAKAIGQDHENKGSHGFRWNFAQERFSEVQGTARVNEIRALSIVSDEMGHVRASITEHYLGK